MPAVDQAPPPAAHTVSPWHVHKWGYTHVRETADGNTAASASELGWTVYRADRPDVVFVEDDGMGLATNQTAADAQLSAAGWQLPASDPGVSAEPVVLTDTTLAVYRRQVRP